MDRQVFITEEGDQRLYELRSGTGRDSKEANESEYVVLSLVTTNDGTYMSEIYSILMRSKKPDLEYWNNVFEAARRDNYLVFQDCKE